MPETLPKMIQELSDLIGTANTLRLVEKRGGVALRIPLGVSVQGKFIRSALADIVGEQEADKLIARYGGTELYIPNCKQQLTMSRDIALHKERDELAEGGTSERSIVYQLALKYRISDRHVWRILKKPLSRLSKLQEQFRLF